MSKTKKTLEMEKEIEELEAERSVLLLRLSNINIRRDIQEKLAENSPESIGDDYCYDKIVNVTDLPGAYVAALAHCLRCGRIHAGLTFRVFSRQSGYYTHWAYCPVTLEPLLRPAHPYQRCPKETCE